jgi:hypothetical protein
MDLARLDHEVDVVIRDQVTEALGDAAEFEFQRNLLIWSRRGWTHPYAQGKPAPTAMISP